MTSLSHPEVYEKALAAQVQISDERLLYLEKILNSQIFRRSNRIRRFLRYLVTWSLNAAADSPKEYALGIEVFDRDTDYDPRLDPIVRVEARRLRAKLSIRSPEISIAHSNTWNGHFLKGTASSSGFLLIRSMRSFVGIPGLSLSQSGFLLRHGTRSKRTRYCNNRVSTFNLTEYFDILDPARF